MKKPVAIVISIVLVLLAGALWWYASENKWQWSSRPAAELLKADIPLLQGTIVTVRENDGSYYVFSSVDSDSSIFGIAKLESDGHFTLQWTGQEDPQCDAFPKDIPNTLISSCYEKDGTLRPR